MRYKRMGIASNLLKRQIKKAARNLKDEDLLNVDTPVSTSLFTRPEKLNNVEVENKQVSNTEFDARIEELDEATTATDWQKKTKKFVSESRDVNPTVRTPELENSTMDLIAGKITREQHLNNVDEYKPVNPWDALPREPSSKATVFSLKPNQREDGFFVLSTEDAKSLGVTKSLLAIGQRFLGRLDIPAYKDYDTWIVAGKSPKGEKGTVYAKAIHYGSKDGKPVVFRASQGKSEKIGKGKADPDYTPETHEKTGYATVDGIVQDLDVRAIRAKAAKYLNDPEWTQVGFDPRRQGGFYVRAGDNKHVPIREASEVIQIGPLVLAKNAKLDFEHVGYAEGGAVTMNRQMKLFKDGGLKDEGGMIDEVSGNEVPIGGTKKGVRDDIAVNISEGEFVMPADVVRYHGLDKMMQIRQEAKMGLKQMEAMGQMGNSDEATIPDDMPFGMADLIVVGAGDEPMEFANGGFVPSYAPGGTVKLTDNASKYEGYRNAPATSFQELMGDAYAEVVMYINAAGDMLAVPYINGSPVYPIPDGYILYDPSVTKPTEGQAEAVNAVANANAVIRDNDDRDRQQQPPPKPPVKWQEISTDEFMAEAGKMVGIGRTVINVATMFMGPLSLLTKGMMVINDRSVAKEIAQRIKSGEFSAAQLETLNGITEKLSGSGGLIGSVLGGIINTVGNLFGASKEEKEAVAKVENIITKVKQPVAKKPEAQGSGLAESEEFKNALQDVVTPQQVAYSTSASRERADPYDPRIRRVVPEGQNVVSTTTTGGGSVFDSGTSQAQLEETRLGIDPDRNIATVSGQVPTTTSVNPYATTSETTSGSPYADAFGDYTGSRALTNVTDTIRELQAESAKNPYSNLPTAVTPASGDPRAGVMQYSGPSSSAATPNAIDGPFAGFPSAPIPVQAQMVTAFGQKNVTPQTQKQVIAPTVQTPGFDPSGGNYAVTPQQVAYSTSASRGSEDPYDPRGIMPTSEQIAFQPQRTTTPIIQSNAAGMPQGSNVYVNPNTGSYDEVPVVPKKVVVGGDGSGAGSSAVVDTSTGTGTQDQTKMVFNDEDYTPTSTQLNQQLTDLGLVNKTDAKFAQPVDFSQTKLGESYDTTVSGSELSGLDLLAEENAAIDPNAGLTKNQFGEYGRPDGTDTSNAVETVTPSKTIVAEVTADSIRNEDPGGALYDEFGDVVKESFGDAFARNKSAGKSTFTHEGNVYTTETAEEKAATSDTGTAATSTVATSNVVNNTGTAVVKEDQSRYGDAGEGNVWAVQPGTNVVTKIKDPSSNNNTSSSTVNIQDQINKQIKAATDSNGNVDWNKADVGDLVKQREAGVTTTNKDNDDNKGSGSGIFGGYSCYVATALNDAGYWSTSKKLKLIKWCIEAKPENKLDTKLWRNGYVVFGKNVIAPKINNKIIQWLSNGFYCATVQKKINLQAVLGKLFFYIPSYSIGLWKALRGNLVDIERT